MRGGRGEEGKMMGRKEKRRGREGDKGRERRGE